MRAPVDVRRLLEAKCREPLLRRGVDFATGELRLAHFSNDKLFQRSHMPRLPASLLARRTITLSAGYGKATARSLALLQFLAGVPRQFKAVRVRRVAGVALILLVDAGDDLVGFFPARAGLPDTRGGLLADSWSGHRRPPIAPFDAVDQHHAARVEVVCRLGPGPPRVD
nr:hypothetical protein [Sphingomonas sp.]